MKKSIILTFFLTFTSLFAQNTPATKDDIKMLIEQNRILREDMNKRFEMMQNQTDKRFEMMQNQMNERFEDMQNMMFFGFALIAAILGFLFIQNQSMAKSIGRIESSIINKDSVSENYLAQERFLNFPPNRTSSIAEYDEERFLSLLKNSDKQTKQKIAKEIKQLLEV